MVDPIGNSCHRTFHQWVSGDSKWYLWAVPVSLAGVDIA